MLCSLVICYFYHVTIELASGLAVKQAALYVAVHLLCPALYLTVEQKFVGSSDLTHLTSVTSMVFIG